MHKLMVAAIYAVVTAIWCVISLIMTESNAAKMLAPLLLIIICIPLMLWLTGFSIFQSIVVSKGVKTKSLIRADRLRRRNRRQREKLERQRIKEQAKKAKEKDTKEESNASRQEKHVIIRQTSVSSLADETNNDRKTAPNTNESLSNADTGVAWDSVLRGLITNSNTDANSNENVATVGRQALANNNGRKWRCLRNCESFWFDKRETYVNFRQSAHEALLECKAKLVDDVERG